MLRRVKDQPEVCACCKYHILFEGSVCCNYLSAKKHSRIYENGEAAYDPDYCDKFASGKMAHSIWRDYHFDGTRADVYVEYKCQRMREEGIYQNDYRNRG